jgi:hypothetical protein
MNAKSSNNINPLSICPGSPPMLRDTYFMGNHNTSFLWEKFLTYFERKNQWPDGLISDLLQL